MYRRRCRSLNEKVKSRILSENVEQREEETEEWNER